MHGVSNAQRRVYTHVERCLGCSMPAVDLMTHAWTWCIVCVDVCIDVCIDMCTGICTDLRTNLCVDMCIDMRIDM